MIGLVAIGLRVLTAGLLGGGVTGRVVLVRLPEVPLPAWTAGVRLGGPVTLEGLLAAAYDGLRLAAILACLGAANALASPRRLLRYVPATLYDVGTAVVVALTYAPQMVQDAGRVRAARRLRGHSTRGLRSIARLAVPVMAGALDRSLDLAASMESRGYGRAVHRTDASRRGASAMTLAGLLGILVGLYGLLDASTPPLLGLPWSWPARCWPAWPCSRAPGARPGRATAATRGRCRSGWCRSAACCRRCAGDRDQQAWEGITPVQVPAGDPRPAAARRPRHRVRRTRRRRAPVPPQRAAPAGRRGKDLMIEFHDVSIRFEGDDRDRLSHVDFTVPEGELVLVVGPTGSGKSTLLRCINGLVPHFSGGRLSGSVVVAGRDTRTHRPRDLADLVGVVVQDPVASFVTDTVEEEIAYGMEAMGVEATAMRRRVEETLDLLGLAGLRGRSLQDLSGGQQQRVAIAAVLAAGPRILVLDEPTSALDPVAAEDVLAALHRLVHDLGITVVLAEHRLERVIHHADRVLLVSDGRTSPLLEPGRGDAHLHGLPPGHRAGPGHRLDAAAAVGAGRPPPRGRAADGPRRPRPATPARDPGRRRVGAGAAARACDAARSPPCAASTSTWPAAA